jgi:hypothetical protein
MAGNIAATTAETIPVVPLMEANLAQPRSLQPVEAPPLQIPTAQQPLLSTQDSQSSLPTSSQNPTPTAFGIELPSAARGLIQQVSGASPVTESTPTLPPADAPNRLRTPHAATTAASSTLLPEVLRPLVAQLNPVQPAGNAASVATPIAAPVATPVAPTTVAVLPPTVNTASTPSTLPPPTYVGDPVLNKIADFATSQKMPTEAVSSLMQPLAGVTTVPPNVGTTAATAAQPASAMQSTFAPPTAATLTAGLPVAPLTLPYPMTSTPAPLAIPEPTLTTPEGHSILLQPFYQTNGRPTSNTGAPQRTANDIPNPSFRDAVVASPIGTLLRQLALSSNDDLRKPAPPTSPAFPAEQNSWDGGWATSNRSDAALVAYLQESEAIPEPAPADLDVRTGESVADGQGGQNPNGQTESLSQAEHLGEKPEDNTLQFLRATTVLLEPGEAQIDVGINYALTEADFPLLLTDGMGDIVGVADANFRIRTLSVPLEYRIGLTKRVQGFIGLPLGWSNTQINVNTLEDFRNDGGIGDLNFGFTIQLKEAEVDKPYWVSTLAVIAPTGGSPFAGVLGLAPSAPSLGQGFWSVQGNLTFIQPYDPVVLFYGLGMERYFESRYSGIDIEPGAQYSYTLGVGFAVNDRVTLSSRFRGAYIEETEADGLRVPGSNQEPMTLRFSATVSKPCNRIVEPFIEFGLTDDSVSSFLGVTWTFQPTKNQAEAAAKRQEEAKKK